MKKRSIALLLVLCMVASMFVGCAKQENPSVQEPQTNNPVASTPEPSTGSETETVAEPTEIDFLTLNMPYYKETFDSYGKESPLYAEIIKQTDVELNIVDLDEDQTQIRIAGNDLGDLIAIEQQRHLTDLVESELVQPWNEWIEQYAPQIIEEMPEMWEAAQALYENEDGLVYALPVCIGNEGTNQKIAHYLYTVRWDLYKAAGYPELNTPDDMIQALSDMMAIQPTTEDGRKVYGASFYVTDTSFFGLVDHMAGTYGFIDEKESFVHRNVQTDELIYTMTDEGPYWMATEYYNKAYRAGILDPDSFTQQAADFSAKIDNGELICPDNWYDTDYENSQFAKDPNSLGSFVSIPVEGCMFYKNMNWPGGWQYSNAFVLPKTCDDPEAVLRLLTFLYSEEGARTINSGIEGVHWDFVDGVPMWKDEYLKMKMEGGEDWAKTGIKQTCFEVMSGYVGGHILSDGYHVDLSKDEAYLGKVVYTPAMQEFTELYDTTWPGQPFMDLRDAGKMYDLSTVDRSYSIKYADEDIDRIDNACIKIAIEAIPKLVTAESDEAYAAIKAETLAALEAAGASEAKAFYLNQWDEVRAKAKG